MDDPVCGIDVIKTSDHDYDREDSFVEHYQMFAGENEDDYKNLCDSASRDRHCLNPHTQFAIFVVSGSANDSIDIAFMFRC